MFRYWKRQTFIKLNSPIYFFWTRLLFFQSFFISVKQCDSKSNIWRIHYNVLFPKGHLLPSFRNLTFRTLKMFIVSLCAWERYERANKTSPYPFWNQISFSYLFGWIISHLRHLRKAELPPKIMWVNRAQNARLFCLRSASNTQHIRRH